MRRGLIAALALIVSVWVTPAAFAVFHPGDIIVGGVVVRDVGVGVQYTGKIRQFAPDGSLIQEFYSGDGYTVDLKFSPSGILYGAGGNIVFRFANDGSMLTPLIARPYQMKSLAFARSGDLFATTGDGAVVKFGSDGSQQGVMPLGTDGSAWADLGMDQCTLYFCSSLHIGRFNLCNNTILPLLPTTLEHSGYTLLVLPDGTLLASTNRREMYHIQQDGTVLRRYSTQAIAYARDISPNFVWVGSGVGFAKFDLQNDVIAAGPFDHGIVGGISAGITGIAIVGADVQAIPALSPLLLALLALAVAIAALLRLRT